MSRLTKGEWAAPFWGKSTSLSGGRDPLGMQNASTATYATMLPGLTNLTQHIRYYGFYCWITNHYANTIRNDSRDVFNKFIRRAELLYAYAMVIGDRSLQGIVGSDYVKNNLPESGKIDLAKGADRDRGTATYWKYSSGAFGQYYLGSLVDLGLVVEAKEDGHRLGVYVCTDLGETLAKGFDEALNDSHKKIFSHAVKEGSVKLTDIKDFAEKILVSSIQVGSNEWKRYVDLLVGPDQGVSISASQTFLRKDTLIKLLKYISIIEGDEVVSWEGLPVSIFNEERKQSNLNEEFSSLGWYYYQLNEYCHYSVEAIFWALLETLRVQPRPIPISTITEEMQQGIVSSLEGMDKILSYKKGEFLVNYISQIEKTNLNEEDFLKMLVESIKSHDLYGASAKAMVLILALFNKHFLKLDGLQKIMLEKNLTRDGDAIELLQVVEKFRNRPLEDFIENIIIGRIINRHLYVAMRKAAGGERITLKFMLEDNSLVHLDTVSPHWTSPRIYSLYTYLKDLKLIDTDGKITSFGEALLKKQAS